MAGMKRKRILSALLIAASITLSVVLYFAAYFTLGTSDDNYTVRVFKDPWQANLFMPAAKIESLMVGHSVSTVVWTRTRLEKYGK